MKNRFLFFLLVFCFSCSKIVPRKPINPKPSTTLFVDALKQNKILNQLENDKILQIIEKDSTKVYLQSSNGFWYTYIQKIAEDLATPKEGDEVVFEYNITDLNDTIIYSKKDLGLKNYVVDKEDFISGLQKGIKLMKIGETITFVIPSYSAFGIAGDAHKIGINQSIKSTVTLINIK
ncbi:MULTISPECIES: gliding motility-associated peptidyl-prolyl isomerase GldI [unclassified Polaribacter]|uniref:gliding motility-associated peptidyl-prolyl isomerase GldI n=1 Tax=unclassified Polaribacter TaxID=196858 RepID=UPI0011BE1BCA|nr:MULTISPECIES: gliding motility-associated peptidyl-prolyl isomerase GldI [unclassified Polaribacter]TXD49599.1 gliding motility-associated peptidyl-prolyl isomerase GldI [Polaribacter sp. IC063]TXD59081.1 gliding motility-associated peptidyl-prolyl isomerase GldI [Polaribacter sp. IC066]